MDNRIHRRERGPIESLCDEIGFRFDREIEQQELLISFVSVLVEHIAHDLDIQGQISHLTKKPPAAEAADHLAQVQEMLTLGAGDEIIQRSREIHSLIGEPQEEITYLLHSCVSAIRFGLEAPCRSRHAAHAAQNVWKHKYGLTRSDRFTSNWQHDWTRAQLTTALSCLQSREPRP